MHMLDYVLSVGVEGFAPPAEGEPENIEQALLVSEALVARSVSEAILSETEINNQSHAIADLTRLASGLEGLMIEVGKVEDKADMTDEEMTALRVSSMSVRRDLLSEEQRRVVSAVDEGRVQELGEGTEGLGDVVRNVKAKLSYAFGNWMDSFKVNLRDTRNLSTNGRTLVDNVYKRIQQMPDVTFTRELNKREAQATTLNGKSDMIGCATISPAAVETWFISPLKGILNQSEKVVEIFGAMMKADSMETLDGLAAKLLPLVTYPVPEGSIKITHERDKVYTYDVHAANVSFAARCMLYYVARPYTDAHTPTEFLAQADAVASSFSTPAELPNRTMKSGSVSCSKADLLAALDSIKKAMAVTDAYNSQISALSAVYSDYSNLCKDYDAFLAKPFVALPAQKIIGVTAALIQSLLYTGCQPVTGTLTALLDLVNIIKSTVYSTDLSKG